MKNCTYLILISLLFINWANAQAIAPKREFRGVWIATVENIDWPRKPAESSDQQQQELAAILDAHQAAGINAVCFRLGR